MKRMPDEEALMIGQSVIGNRSCDLWDLLSSVLLGQIGDLLRDRLTLGCAASISLPDPQNTSEGMTSELEVRIFKHLLLSTPLPRVFTGQLPEATLRVAQLTHGKRQDEAEANYAVTKQVSEQTATVLIGLVTAPVLYLGRIRVDHLDRGFQQVEDRFLVAAGALHHRMDVT